MLRRVSGRCSASMAVGTTVQGRECATTPAEPLTPPTAAVAQYAPYRTVGGIFLVRCADHPFKHSWEVTKTLRDLRFEFRGQVAIHPDIPDVRQRLWRARHALHIERLDLDQAKEMVGIPKHIRFTDLASQIPSTFGRTKATANPQLRSKMNFMRYRRMRIRDILHRDDVEKRLLRAKKLAKQQAAAAAASTA